jgi:hypothetical protein
VRAQRKGILSHAVAKAMQPTFFFAMFEAQDFVAVDANGRLSSRTSLQMSRTSSTILELDDEAVREAVEPAAGNDDAKDPDGKVQQREDPESGDAPAEPSSKTHGGQQAANPSCCGCTIS